MSAERLEVGVSGPGLIGRTFTRTTVLNPELGIDVTGISYHSPSSKDIASLLRYCSINGALHNAKIEAREGNIFANGKGIRFFAVPEPQDIPWEGQRLIVESSRVSTDPKRAVLHLKAGGPRKVVISSSPKRNECPTIIFGVNQDIYDSRKDDVVSAGTCSTNAIVSALAPLRDSFGIRLVVANIVHAATGSNTVYDRIGEDPENRAIIDNIVPDNTGAAKTVPKIFPEIPKENIIITARRVPVTNGSEAMITVGLGKTASLRDVVNCFEEAVAGRLKGVLELTENQITAADIRGDTHASVIPVPNIKILAGGSFVSFSVSYDNANGYVGQLIRTINHIWQQGL